MNGIQQAPDVFNMAAQYWISRRGRKRMKFLIERDDNIRYEDPFDGYVYKGPSSIRDYEKSLLHYLRSPVLDLGCGAGRFAVPLSQAGYSVVGIDISAAVLEICRASTKEHASMIQMSINQLGFAPDVFASAIAMTYNVGLAGNLEGLGYLLHHLNRACVSGGYFILTSIDVSKRWDYQSYYLDRFSKGREMGQTRIRFLFGGVAGDWFDWLYVTPEDLRRVSEENGWNVVEIKYGVTQPDRYAAVLENVHR